MSDESENAPLLNEIANSLNNYISGQFSETAGSLNVMNQNVEQREMGDQCDKEEEDDKNKNLPRKPKIIHCYMIVMIVMMLINILLVIYFGVTIKTMLRPMLPERVKNATVYRWKVIQRRVNGSTDFYRNWADYREGFGDVNGNFWIGLDNISLLTQKTSHLRIKFFLWHDPARIYEMYWDQFSVGSNETAYQLSIGGFNSQRSAQFKDDFSAQDGAKFSTKDVQNVFPHNCALDYQSGFWFHTCYDLVDLNGKYYSNGSIPADLDGILYYHVKNSYRYSLPYVEMAVGTAEMKIKTATGTSYLH